jgi:hypothetical protein
MLFVVFARWPVKLRLALAALCDFRMLHCEAK